MPRTVSKQELLESAGADLGVSEWLTITQERIDRFADATDDHQFIHVDPERAAATPFGATIAHGFLTLSLLPHLSEPLMLVPDRLQMAINYGLNRVRFVEPVRVGSSVRLRMRVNEVREKSGARILATLGCTLEIRGSEKPAYQAEMLALFVVEGGDPR